MSQFEIDTDAIREAGTVHFPEIADAYATTCLFIEHAQGLCASGLRGSDIFQSWSFYNAQITSQIETSKAHLEACGETLVDVAETFGELDDETELSISNAYEGSLAEALPAE
ncbi:hypothetical protein FB566_4077 [Stackebrandtia endophytica]|uniref:Excreted virulence factor EspC (Type VII ESX diderm) n=1 Tax=Stackebrandtia endophytica TaxID=1496996 RepID=A0A543B0Z6_9ACTN|nr:hypothetical protein [Stackebrandtia endophytica]TQL78489.1 hypothetical protein FB566_4077 [Stackebrandtia endophytica]